MELFLLRKRVNINIYKYSIINLVNDIEFDRNVIRKAYID